jgi:hypothetical protein
MEAPRDGAGRGGTLVRYSGCRDGSKGLAPAAPERPRARITEEVRHAVNPSDIPDLPSASVRPTDVPGSIAGTVRKQSIFDATNQDLTRLTALDLA